MEVDHVDREVELLKEKIAELGSVQVVISLHLHYMLLSSLLVTPYRLMAGQEFFLENCMRKRSIYLRYFLLLPPFSQFTTISLCQQIMAPLINHQAINGTLRAAKKRNVVDFAGNNSTFQNNTDILI